MFKSEVYTTQHIVNNFKTILKLLFMLS